jgi:methylenetetrahydrofolate dehydrogenase (NADP+)/methenyltetrahydrofolate cyclohydrolase
MTGAPVAEQIKGEVGARVRALAEAGLRPGLAVVIVGDDPASQVYVNSKVRACQSLGLHSEKYALPATATTTELLMLIGELNRREEIDGILVQLPLPPQIETRLILEAIDPSKDVDGFHAVNVGRLVRGEEALVACTPAGIIDLLDYYRIPIAGARAVVVGRSDIVGKPLALLLLHRHATVTICHSRTRDLPAVAREAEILVAAIGRTAMITGDYVCEGAAVIDVGINRVENAEEVRRIFPDAEHEGRLADLARRGYTIAGDVEPRTAEARAGYLTPVPGGVGPLTIARLMKNTLRAMELRRGAR